MTELEILLDHVLIFDKKLNAYIIPHKLYHDVLVPILKAMTEDE